MIVRAEPSLHGTAVCEYTSNFPMPCSGLVGNRSWLLALTEGNDVTGSGVGVELKPVSDARFGDQVARVGGVGLEFPAQIGQVHP